MPSPAKETGLLLEHARVISMDPTRPEAEAVLCRHGRIEAVGTTEQLEKLLRSTDTRFDCGNLPLVPGLIDSHTHFLSLGLKRLRVDLSGARDRAAALAQLRTRALAAREGEWVYGIDFDESRWEGDRALPTREDLDRVVSARHRVVMRRVCGHIAVANTLALEAVSAAWDHVDRATGVMKEGVVERLSEVVGTTEEEARKAIEVATRLAYERGVTSVVDIVDARTLVTYLDMDGQGRMGIRVFCALNDRDLPASGASGVRAVRGSEGGMVHLVGVKAYLDGSLGARTAALSAPYADDPTTSGELFYDLERLRALVRNAKARGLQLFLHAIGDRAIQLALDALAAEVAPGDLLRHRIEHLECYTHDQLHRMKELRVVASIQPNFAAQWAGPGGMNEQRLGPERARACDGLRDVWSHGMPLAFGSDCMPFGPMLGLQGAVNHPVEEQSLPVMVALRAYTAGSAYAVHAEDWLGMISPGMAADLVLLSDDLEEAEDLSRVRPVLTVLGGFMVHVDSEGYNEAVNRAAKHALEEALMEADVSHLGLEGPREDDEGDE